jgi:hypothetical protein
MTRAKNQATPEKGQPEPVMISDLFRMEAEADAIAVAENFSLDRMPSRRQVEQAIRELPPAMAAHLEVFQRNIPFEHTHEQFKACVEAYLEAIQRILYPPAPSPAANEQGE